MKRAPLFPIVVLATLAACGDDVSQSGQTQTATRETNAKGEVADEAELARNEEKPSEAPGFNREMTYYFSRSERGPTLSYGVPRTDNIALSLRCPAGGMGKTLLVYFNRPAHIVAQRPGTLTLKSGDAQRQFAVETSETQLGTTVEVQTSPESAPIRSFRDGDTLEVTYGNEPMAIPSRSDDGEIREFFDACSARPNSGNGSGGGT